MVLIINRNFALLYGIMLGDGCLSLVYGKKKYISLAGSMADDIPFFEKIVNPAIKKLIDKDIPIKFRYNKNAIELNFVNHKLFDFIHKFDFPIGKKGDKLIIPKTFYEKNLVKYLIRGFFATDGSLVLTDNNGTLYPRVEATAISKSLLIEITNFLNAVGIKCNFYKAKRREENKNKGYSNRQEIYRLQINGKNNLKRFVKTIGFVNPKQIEKLEGYHGCTKS
ncbi:hypothetical protein COV15_00675 [Candidatus Woesearchaeota archaeon CG10_big_fil_rev_8_21_14_0_10_34_12]|nr:MAG: hypothetical protein COV15_00675 [Candidatus Woesearchaeota archaeon CG10_big_fil_rev_8_21_14_0_10_34_12]